MGGRGGGGRGVSERTWQELELRPARHRRGPRLAGADPPGGAGALRGSRDFPRPRDEEWRFTPVAPDRPGHLAAGRRARRCGRRAIELAPFIVRPPGVDHAGLRERARYSRELSARSGRSRPASRCSSLAEALAGRRRAARDPPRHATRRSTASPFTALNTALVSRRRRFVHVPAGRRARRARSTSSS